MTLLSAYLSKERVKKVLSSKPGQDGFSLIELVVVVAVLAVLSAVAIPNFQSMTQKARSAAASNSVATVAKECAVKFANGEASGTSRAAVSLDGYTSLTNGNHTAAGATPVISDVKCWNAANVTIQATSSDTSMYPTFIYDINAGTKTCTFVGDEAAQKKVGCNSGKW